MQRLDGRKNNDLRSIQIEPGFMPFAEGSCLIKCGNTHVICSATIDNTLPHWLKGQGQGWISAEYNMLPRSTDVRMQRERQKLGGRTVEIQRLIGRALRACLDMKKLGEKSIIIDCDVIRADGGTRTASITGGYVALKIAVQKLLNQGLILQDPFVDSVSAISCGIYKGEPIIDLNYLEDSQAEVDMNFVITGRGHFVEIQGTAEKGVFSWDDMERMKNLAMESSNKLKEIQNSVIFST